MSLIDPLLLETGLLADIARPVKPLTIEWFKGVNFKAFFQNVLIPLAILMIVAFFLKQRYDAKQKRRHQQELDDLDAQYRSPFG